MSNVDKIRNILIALGVPEKQQNELCCHVLLVMGKIYPDSKWEDAKNEWNLRVVPVLAFGDARLTDVDAHLTCIEGMTSSVKLPRSSTFIFNGKAVFS